MKKINVAELLKDCPSGMELDCTMYENVYFNQIYDDDGCLYKIGCYTIVDGIRTSINFTKFGEFNTHKNSKCVIYPKGKTTWEGFQRPFKDGDIVALDSAGGSQVFIFKEYMDTEKDCAHCYVMLDDYGAAYFEGGDFYVGRFATEEEKEKLFDAINTYGYKWNPETKTLEKLNEPKFKDGDIVTNGKFIAIFHKIEWGHTYYHCRYNNHTNNSQFKIYSGIGFIDEYHLATEEEKQKLFNAIKANGYKWDNVTKVLYKIVEPKFKIGDIIKGKCNLKWKVIDVNSHYYEVSLVFTGTTKLLEIKAQDDYELVPNKFDINTLKPFDKVLVRDFDNTPWEIEFFQDYSTGSISNV